MDIIKSIEHEQLKNKVPNIEIGDTVRVHQRIKEGNRERIQVFEGIVIKKQNGGLNETFTVRRVAYGVGVEKTFLLHSPLVEKVELVRVGKVRRAKLYYLRDRIGKAAKTKENIGANLNREDITVKEEMPPVETATAEEVEAVEETAAKTEETVEVKEEKTEKAEVPKAEKSVEAKETAKAPKAEKSVEAKETAKAPKVEKSAETKKTEKAEKTTEVKKEAKTEKKDEVNEEKETKADDKKE